MSVSYEPLWLELEKRKMKRKDLMEIADVSANCIANMGKKEYISMRNIEKIARSLNITPDKIFTIEEEKN